MKNKSHCNFKNKHKNHKPTTWLNTVTWLLDPWIWVEIQVGPYALPMLCLITNLEYFCILVVLDEAVFFFFLKQRRRRAPCIKGHRHRNTTQPRQQAQWSRYFYFYFLHKWKGTFHCKEWSTTNTEPQRPGEREKGEKAAFSASSYENNGLGCS
jgi:hypothetical protein